MYNPTFHSVMTDERIVSAIALVYSNIENVYLLTDANISVFLQ